MPIRRMLEGRNFTPEAAAILVEAFGGMVEELDLQAAADRERAARIIIRLALTRVTLDAEELRNEAIGLMRDERAEGHGRNLDHPEGPSRSRLRSPRSTGEDGPRA